MTNYIILSKTQKYKKYANMKDRCGKAYQKENPRYEGTFMWEGWDKHRRTTLYVWLDNNYYEISGEQMDIDKDIVEYGNKQYHPDLCLIVPHSINVFYETIEVGQTNIRYNSRTKKYRVVVHDKGTPTVSTNIDTYNDALDIYCDIKQGILVNKAKALKDMIPEKVYLALMATDIKAINHKYYKTEEGEV